MESSGSTAAELRELADDWRVSLRGAGKADGTITAYTRGVGQFLTFCEAAGLDPIRRRTLSAWMAHLRDEKNFEGYTARSRLTSVRQFTKWLLVEGEIDSNPFVEMEQPAVDERLTEPLTPQQIHALLDTCVSPKGAGRERIYVDTRDAAIIAVMIETGLRAGEVVGLSVDDVQWRADPPHLLIQRTKTRTARSVPISVQAADRLNRYARARRRQKDHNRTEFWLSARGGPLRYQGLYDGLVKRSRLAGISGFHPHQMRHTAAHRWLEKGGSESGLMSVAGWRSPQMLHRYTKAQAAARAAEEAQKLNLGEL